MRAASTAGVLESALLPLVRDEIMDLAVTQRTRIHLDAGLDF